MSIATGAGTAPKRSQRGLRLARSAPRSSLAPVLAPALALGAAAGSLLLLVAAGGCRESTTREASLELDEPRTNGGVFLTEDDPVRLAEIAAALDAMRWDGSPSAGQIVTSPAASLPVAFPEGVADLPQTPEFEDDAPAPPAAADPEADPPPGEPSGGRRWSSSALSPPRVPGPPDPPLGAVELAELPRLSDVELTDLVDRMALEMQSVRGYVEVADERTLAARLPAVPRGVTGVVTLVRPAA